jgi:hypothetical protein
LDLEGTKTRHLSLHEAQALASFSSCDENTFIVRYYNAWIEDERLYLVVTSNVLYMSSPHFSRWNIAITLSNFLNKTPAIISQNLKSDIFSEILLKVSNPYTSEMLSI